MQLLAFSCNNIGPFFDRTITVYFRDGKYLIKAPIGSGKSFLFFDGPLFGLYKYSSRPMLSMKAENGRIKILFENNGQVVMCVREISRTKSGNDTVKSSIFTIQDELPHIQQNISTILGNGDPLLDNEEGTSNIVYENIDAIEQLMRKTAIEQVVCKNETDVQSTLDSFLPPKEVFLSTTMLLQDSENVFELPPAERISLFKEIFGLLSIDSATERINEEKRNVTALLKSKGDTASIDKKLQEYLHNIVDYGKELSVHDTNISALINELELIYDKITITDFSLDTDWQNIVEEITTKNRAQQEHLQKTIGAQEQQQNLVDMTAKEIIDLQQQQEQIKQEVAKMQTKLQVLGTDGLQEHTAKKQQLQAQIDSFISSLPNERFNGIEKTPQGLTILRTKMQEDVQQTKILFEQQTSLQKSIQQLRERQEQEKETLASYEKNVTQLKNGYENKKKYECDIAKGYCPFIEKINTSFFTTLQKNITNAQTTLDNYKQKTATSNTAKLLNDEEGKLQIISKSFEEKKSTTIVNNRKEIDSKKKEYDEYIKQQLELQREDSRFTQLAQERENNLLKKVQYEEKLAGITTSLEQAKTKQQQLEKNITIDSITQTQEDLKMAQNTFLTLNKIAQNIDRIHDLINTHKDTKQEIQRLQEREKLLTDLYRIFSKEIMIKVLEDSLPFFAEYINNLLAKMVGFTVSFHPKKTANDKLELEITIRDGHGERPVKSLSGGQKAILRLAWILAVAQITHTAQLFLDETINNIDQDTIGQVTDMLKDYVKFNNISLYLVTHASQLQEMSIRDETVTL